MMINNEFSNAVVSEPQQVNKTSVFAPPKNDSTIAQSLESMAMLSSNEQLKLYSRVLHLESGVGRVAIQSSHQTDFVKTVG